MEKRNVFSRREKKPSPANAIETPQIVYEYNENKMRILQSEPRYRIVKFRGDKLITLQYRYLKPDYFGMLDFHYETLGLFNNIEEVQQYLFNQIPEQCVDMRDKLSRMT